jgi:hypothetical protein
MLEKLLGVGSFGCSIDHLTRRHATLLVSSGGFGLLFVVWIIAPTFLGCWALFTLAFVTRFQQDDRPIFLDAVTHV